MTGIKMGFCCNKKLKDVALKLKSRWRTRKRTTCIIQWRNVHPAIAWKIASVPNELGNLGRMLKTWVDFLC